MDKNKLRKIIRQEKRQFSKTQLEELSLPVLQRLHAHPAVRNAHHILLYYSLDDEVCTHGFIDQLVAEGKHVYLPRVTGATDMELREYTGKEDLCEGAFHIMEPTGTLLPEERYDEIETGVIPGMAFDSTGHRLGRGKGYYDRLLAKMPHIYKIGVCFDFQKAESIPTEATDIMMDAMV